jgi:hypothetical protein
MFENNKIKNSFLIFPYIKLEKSSVFLGLRPKIKNGALVFPL